MKQLIITAALSLVASIATIVAAENHPTPSLRGPAALVSGIAFLMTCDTFHSITYCHFYSRNWSSGNPTTSPTSKWSTMRRASGPPQINAKGREITNDGITTQIVPLERMPVRVGGSVFKVRGAGGGSPTLIKKGVLGKNSECMRARLILYLV